MSDEPGNAIDNGVGASQTNLAEPVRLSVGFVAGVLILYAISLAAGTYPAVLHIEDKLAATDLADPLQHLWTFRWYRDCLLDGRLPFFTPGLQYPTGSPLGLYSPMQLQSVLYIVGRLFSDNDILLYNLILVVEFLFTGMATFAVAWQLTRSRGGAAVAGLVTMLSGPMTFNTLSGGTELMALGGFPLFLLAWLRFVNAPTRSALFKSIGLYALLSACAPYYGVMAIFPATLYVVYQFATARKGERSGWVHLRWRWLASFGVLAGLVLPVLFMNQVWAAWNGYPMVRSRLQFEEFGSSLVNYVLPMPDQGLVRAVFPNAWLETLLPWFQSPTEYLGVVTIGLLLVAALGRVRFNGSRFLWISLAMFVVLSLGAYANVFGKKVPLPALWLWEICPPFRSLRVPARFGYFGVVCAALLAAGALGCILKRLPGDRSRCALTVALMFLAVFDLGRTHWDSRPVPSMPSTYQAILAREPNATFCEIYGGFNTYKLRYESVLAYWQSFHKARTSAGNPGVLNRKFDNRVSSLDPFDLSRMADVNYLADPRPLDFDLVRGVSFEEYAWLFLSLQKFDYLIIHKWKWDEQPQAPAIPRIRDRLADGIVMENDAVTVIDRRKLPPPTRPLVIGGDGWRTRLYWEGRYLAVMAEGAEVVVYNPKPGQTLQFSFLGESYRRAKSVRLEAEGKTLASWNVPSKSIQRYDSPPLALPQGLHTLRLVSDGLETRNRIEHPAFEGNPHPLSIAVSELRIDRTEEIASKPRADATERR